MLYDVFICHAHEDKPGLVRPMAELLRQNHLEVWYDELTLKAGDSLRRSIDLGLSKSRYGVVVLSQAFFAKGWAQWELDGLLQRQVSGGSKVIIPIWHGVGREDVERYSYPLADKVAIPSSLPIEEVVQRVLAVVKPQGSTLLIARDILIEHGLEPPVVTDDWWLDVVEEFADRSGRRWSLQLPLQDCATDDSPRGRGRRLAWRAMELLWQEAADREGVCQISHPSEVFAFIDEQAGMPEACMLSPWHVLEYAPQLAIPGFGGRFEPNFDELLEKSARAAEAKGPRCARELALRHPNFGAYRPGSVACMFVQGTGAGLGPHTRLYDIIDYVVWFLSNKSDWLPRRHHAFLLQGMKDWAMWPWHDYSDSGYEAEPESGSLALLLHRACSSGRRPRAFRFTREAQTDLLKRLTFSAKLLDLPESGEELVSQFQSAGFIESWLTANSHLRETSKRSPVRPST